MLYFSVIRQNRMILTYCLKEMVNVYFNILKFRCSNSKLKKLIKY